MVVSAAALLGATAVPAVADDADPAFTIDVSTVDGGSPTGVCAEVFARADAGDPLAVTCVPDGTTRIVVPRSAQLPLDEPDATYVVRVTAGAPYAPSWYGSYDWSDVAFATPTAVTGTQALDVVLARAATVTGRLLDDDGSPATSGRVIVASDDGPRLGETEITQGRWSLPVYPGLVRVFYERDGRRQWAGQVRATSDGTVDLGDYRFVPDAEAGKVVVSGQVRDAASGKPIAGACLYARGLPSYSDEERLGDWDAASGCPYSAPVARSDAHGRFRALLQPAYESPVEGRYPAILSVIDPTGTHTRRVTTWGLEVRPGMSVTHDFVLDPAYALKGRVVDATGAPVAGVCPLAVDLDLLVTQLRRCSGADGWYLAGELPAELAAKRFAVKLWVLGDQPWDGWRSLYAPGVATPQKGAKISLKPGKAPTVPTTTLTSVRSAGS
ncbi:MAG: hypothetical protein U0Q15_00295 [Kineosporiaceae bacterium]